MTPKLLVTLLHRNVRDARDLVANLLPGATERTLRAAERHLSYVGDVQVGEKAVKALASAERGQGVPPPQGPRWESGATRREPEPEQETTWPTL